MAQRKRAETPDQRMKREHAEQVRRAPAWDPMGVYAQKSAELAEVLGIKASEIYEEHCSRAAIRHYLGEKSIMEAERLAWQDTEERFLKQRTLL